ncbi:flippase [Motilimonas sp. KMU-193]|uniref:flippase n=1 Tax=Motilimonas sp. KMU-193 TaxID=3388668 RepID=UPI00396B1B4A
MINNLIFRNTLWVGLEKSLRLILGVLLSSLIARSLGPAEFGQLNFLISLLVIASVLNSLGLNRIIIREVADHLEDIIFIKTTIITALYLRLLISLILFLFAVIFSWAIWPAHLLYSAVVFSSLFFISFDVFDFYAQGTSNFKIISICRSVAFLITSAMKLAVVFLDGGIDFFVFLILFEHALVAILFYYLFVKKNNANLSFYGVKLERGVQLLRESWPEIIAGFGAIMFMRLDMIFLQWISGDLSVGIYSAATRITEAWYFLPAVIIATTFPKLISLRQSSYSQYLDGIRLLMSLLVTMSLVIAIIFTLTADWIVALLYGSDYAESANVIVLHTWAGLFFCMGIASGSWLVAEKKLKLNLQRNLFGLAVSALTNWLLIPSYGVTGSAVATLAGMSAAFYLFDAFHPQLRPMFKLKTSALLPVYLYHFICERRI